MRRFVIWLISRFLPRRLDRLPVKMRSMKKNVLLASLLLCTVTLAFADGDIILDVNGNTHDMSGALARGSDGRLYAVARADRSPTDSEGESYLLALDANGSLVPSFGNAGKVPGPGGPIAVHSDGRIINGSFRVTTFDAAGATLGSYTACGVFYPCSGSLPRVYANSFLPLPDGRAFSGGGEVFRVWDSSYWTLVRVNADGTKDTAFAGNPDGWVQKAGGPSNQIAEMRFQSSSQIMVLGWHSSNGALALSRFNVDGSTDFTFGTNGVMAIGTSPAFAPVREGATNIPLGIDQSQRILVPTENNIVARRLPDGAIDNSYTLVPLDPQTDYLTFVVDSLDRVVVFGQRGDSAYVARLLPDGGLDPSFGTGGEFTFTSPSPDTSALVLSDGLVDDANRPILYFSVVGATGARDIGLARLTSAGSLDATFGAGVADVDVYPEPFTFASNTAPFGTTDVVSNAVTITGINAPTNVSLNHTPIANNSSVSVGCTGTYVDQAYTVYNHVLVNPGQTICLRHDASTTAGNSVTTTVNVGGRQASYTTTSTMVGADATPDPFSFVDQTGVTPGSQVTSAPVTITGLTGAAPIAIDFGQYSIGCHPDGFRSSPATIRNGQTLCVRLTAPSSFSSSVSAIVAISGVTDAFTVTTVAADTTPDPFQLNALGAVAQSVYASSFEITMTGINAPAPISVTGGEYAIGCGRGVFTAQAGTISNGQTVCVRHVTSAAPGTTVTTTLTVGGVSAAFTSTTAGTSTINSSNSSSSSSSGGGGSVRFGELLFLALVLGSLRIWQLSPAGRRRW
jgi:uncharacterized delta-60 repeat protein